MTLNARAICAVGFVPIALFVEGCTTIPAVDAPAPPPIVRPVPDLGLVWAEAAYDRAKPIAQMLLPFLPPATAVTMRQTMGLIEQALLVARMAQTTAERAAALKGALAGLDILKEARR